MTGNEKEQSTGTMSSRVQYVLLKTLGFILYMVGSQWEIFGSVGICLEELLCGQDGLDLREAEGREPSDTAT